ncbi:Pyridine nucleotide-disulphide oxidoreductase family protein associated with PFOR [hydrothermal vent metagenome]|uniref:Pyridine nucleotide-disulphide oxidoreductase family protein associated with PFOR n=1 Tax=hydrothermal vent metagenome TaxID=652676 RepID=A0A3B0VAX8_9ZZZZ
MNIPESPIKQRDLTTPPDLKKSDGTGPVPLKQPVFANYLPPCNQQCPAGENIQGWLDKVHNQQFEQAWQLLIADNPMPAIHGRVCYHPCETGCNRKFVDNAVSIHQVERHLGDMAIKHGWTPQVNARKSGKKILVVGAGPSGISAAFHLCRMGHDVEVRDAGPIAGGMLHFGIPAYRLPRDILASEIKLIEDMGVKFTLNHKVENLCKEKKAGNFAAVFVAVGAHVSKKINIPAREAGRIMDAVSYLRDVGEGKDLKLGRRVAIYGGGNTAMDAARTAKRLGAEETMIIYRRDMDNMPALKFEAEEAMEEGVKINWLRTIKEIDVDQIRVEKMALDKNGRPVPTGEFETLAADTLILALGQNIDSQLLSSFPEIQFEKDGTVVVNQQMMTSAPGIFAGGDMVPSDRTVTIATGHGKKAARYIHAFLSDEVYQPADKTPVVKFESLHLWYHTDAQVSAQPAMPLDERTKSFDEVLGSLTQDEVTYEASRCYSCGNCFECDGCYGACPEDAIIKLGKGKFYQVDYAKCTGCSACTLQCPTAAIHMVDNGSNEH